MFFQVRQGDNQYHFQLEIETAGSWNSELTLTVLATWSGDKIDCREGFNAFFRLGYTSMLSPYLRDGICYPRKIYPTNNLKSKKGKN